MKKQFKSVLAVALVAALTSPAMAADKIAFVVKSLGNGFFDAANQEHRKLPKNSRTLKSFTRDQPKPLQKVRLKSSTRSSPRRCLPS